MRIAIALFLMLGRWPGGGTTADNLSALRRQSTMIVRRPSGFIEPCLPSKVARPPSGPL